MVFLGQEFLADRWWSDDPNKGDLLIRWADLAGGDPQAADFHQFCTDLIRLRLRHPALRSEPVNAFHADNYSRVFAFHRWVPGLGRDVVVVVSLREAPFADGGYVLGSPNLVAGTRYSTATCMTISRVTRPSTIMGALTPAERRCAE